MEALKQMIQLHNMMIIILTTTIMIKIMRSGVFDRGLSGQHTFLWRSLSEGDNCNLDNTEDDGCDDG